MITTIDIQFVAESSLPLAHYVVVLLKQKEVTSKTSGMRKVKIRMFTAVFGALEYVVYVLDI